MAPNDRYLRSYGFLFTILGWLLLVGMLNLVSPAPALAASDTLEITGDGVKSQVTFTLKQLEGMEQHQFMYSCINTWPTKRWCVGKGVLLRDLFDIAGITGEAKLIRFSSVDGYTVTLTVKELLEDKRYLFPNFKAGGSDSDGHLPGAPSGKLEVAPIISLQSVEGSDNPSYMNDLNSLQLMLGQRAVTEQTGNLFIKNLNKIEALTIEPKKWDAPQANPDGGPVPAGTMVALSNIQSDDDKIYYTTDGSIPDINSPMYNWVASRWWAARADVLGAINRPIGPINKNTTIKAVTIGPGKLDSDVATFNFQVAGAVADDTGPVGKGGGPLLIKLTVGLTEASVNGVIFPLEAAPYISTQAGRTLVPVRFVSEALGAGVGWKPETRQVTISAKGKEIVLHIGSSKVWVNGLQQAIDCAPVIVSGRTFVPLRFISETLGVAVGYEVATRQITITR